MAIRYLGSDTSGHIPLFLQGQFAGADLWRPSLSSESRRRYLEIALTFDLR